MILAYLAMYLVLRFTKLGRDLFVVGGNLEAAKNVGIRIRFPRLLYLLLTAR